MTTMVWAIASALSMANETTNVRARTLRMTVSDGMRQKRPQSRRSAHPVSTSACGGLISPGAAASASFEGFTIGGPRATDSHCCACCLLTMHRVLTPADYRHTTWKNGGGRTTEIAV